MRLTREPHPENAASHEDACPETDWSLVSRDGRASARLRQVMVIGSGMCCDLCLPEDGVSRHHAILTVEDRDLFVTPLAGAPVRVDGEAIHGRYPLRNGGMLSIGPAVFGVRAVGGATPIIHVGPIDTSNPDAAAAEVDVAEVDEAEAAGAALAEAALAEVSKSAAEPDLASPEPDLTPLEFQADSIEAGAAESDSGVSLVQALERALAEAARSKKTPSEPDVTRAKPDVAWPEFDLAPDEPVVAVEAPEIQKPSRSRPEAARVPRRSAPIARIAEASSDVDRPPGPLPTERLPRVRQPQPQPLPQPQPQQLRRQARQRGRTAGIVGVVFVTVAVAVALWWAPSASIQLPLAWFDRFREQPPFEGAAPAQVPSSPTDTAEIAKPGVAPGSVVETAVDRSAPGEPTNATSTEHTDARAAAPAAMATRANDSVPALMSRADALYAKGTIVGAAQTYLQALSIEPDDAVARARLGDAVSRVAATASNMILTQRFEGARNLLRRLSETIPEASRKLVDQNALDQWRVVELLLDADARMQKYQILEPEHDNAVELLHEALRLDPKNPIADEMLSKAFGLLAERNQAATGYSRDDSKSGDARQR